MDANALLARDLTMNAALAFTLPTIEKWANGPCYGDSTNVPVNGTKLAANGSIAGQNSACFPIAPGSTTGAEPGQLGVPGYAQDQAEYRRQLRILIPSMPFKGFVNANALSG
jgi:iron complex outermembrane receptor protein